MGDHGKGEWINQEWRGAGGYRGEWLTEEVTGCMNASEAAGSMEGYMQKKKKGFLTLEKQMPPS